MSRSFETPVLIAGGGPVGVTLAMDLAWRGCEVTVAEKRHRGEAPPVKCNHVSARSMEIFRRLGVAQKLRDAGLPADYPNDVSYRVSFTGAELSRIAIPAGAIDIRRATAPIPGGRRRSRRTASTRSSWSRSCSSMPPAWPARRL